MSINIYWNLEGGGLYLTDPPSRLIIDEYHKKNRVHKSITNHSLQRLIKISLYHAVEIDDGRITVYGAIQRR